MKNYTLGSVILMALIGALISLNLHAQTTNPVGYVNKLGINYKLKNTDNSLDGVEQLSADGIISRDGRFTAYTLNSNNFSTDPYLYIKDLATDKIERFDLDLGYIFSPVEWSPDNKFILVNRFSHYWGGIKTFVWDVTNSRIVNEFNILSNYGK